MDSVGCRCSNDGMRFDAKTKASPAQVRSALTDFTERRPLIWNRTLDPRTYQLRDSGDTWAVARESTSRSPAWVVARYDWSDPDVVRWTVIESSYGGGGEGFVRISPLGDGGSLVHAEWSATDARTQKLLLFLIHHGPMSLLISRLWAAALDRYAGEANR